MKTLIKIYKLHGKLAEIIGIVIDNDVIKVADGYAIERTEITDEEAEQIPKTKWN